MTPAVFIFPCVPDWGNQCSSCILRNSKDWHWELRRQLRSSTWLSRCLAATTSLLYSVLKFYRNLDRHHACTQEGRDIRENVQSMDAAPSKSAHHHLPASSSLCSSSSSVSVSYACFLANKVQKRENGELTNPFSRKMGTTPRLQEQKGMFRSQIIAGPLSQVTWNGAPLPHQGFSLERKRFFVAVELRWSKRLQMSRLVKPHDGRKCFSGNVFLTIKKGFHATCDQ